MHRTLTVALLLSLLVFSVNAQRHDPQLQAGLDSLAAGFHGSVGIFVHHLKRDVVASVNPDSLFPTASMIKVPIMLTLFDRIAHGDLKYNETMTFRDSLRYDDGIVGSFRDSARIPVCELVTLMICFSDNTAALWLQQLAGTGTRINEWLETSGFHQTRMNSRTPGRQAIWEVYGWGMTTPREMATLLTRINEGTAVSPSASQEMQRVLGTIHWRDEALSQIPPWVQTMSKQGAVDESRSEVVLVHAPSGDYVFCVITAHQQDTSWTPENEGFRLIRQVSHYLWQTFEPASPWSPSPEQAQWEK